MFNPILLAILSPFFFALTNVWDKYIVVHRVKNALSYAVIDGLTIFVYSIILSVFVSWAGVSLNALLIPAVIGVLYGASTLAYYYVIQKEDVTHFIGLLYVYPILVAFMSFLFLNEVIPLVGYIGMILTVSGAVLMTTRIKKFNSKVFLYLAVMVVLSAVGEFLVKVSTSHVPELNAIAISDLFLGLTLFCVAFFIPKIRSGIKYEFTHNLHLSVISQIVWVFAIITLFYAMAGLPATIVASLGVLQPLFVLVMERIADSYIGKISRDTLLLPKLGAILLIIIGIALLTMSGALFLK